MNEKHPISRPQTQKHQPGNQAVIIPEPESFGANYSGDGGTSPIAGQAIHVNGRACVGAWS